ncbi:MAG: SagB family peptide dehydrogenase [Candidatus Obscuribacterales bacterium]|nr:SagB family peptide dehydrogenase [Candidatus Obscuribacterales bacterium]
MLPRYPYTLSFKSTAKLEEDDSALLLCVPERSRLRIAAPTPSIRTLLEHLFAGGMTDDQLCEAAMHADKNADPAKIYFFLEKLAAYGMLCYTLNLEGKPFATLQVVASPFKLADLDWEESYQLSRFAYLRRTEDGMIMECPLGKAVMLLNDPTALSAINHLTKSCTLESLSDQSGLEPGAAASFLLLLASGQMIDAQNPSGNLLTEQENTTMRQWEFHDLLFHSRSRLGRHDYGFGPTSRFLGILPPLPAVKEPMSGRRIKLQEPNLEKRQHDSINFFTVVEERKSVRVSGGTPITVAQLGEFLYWVARFKQIYPVDMEQKAFYENCVRPCPSAGAVHEIELYLTVSNCSELEPGLYHYASLSHELEWLSELKEPQKAMLEDARLCSYMTSPPDVLITLAARFQRLSWQYASMAYATMLRNAGVMYQQMYLVATALKLAPCALGRGNSDLFAEATGLDYCVENSIGEFMISGQNH